MSQEPEKEIEKQLREHAEKRRAEAGDQLDLHPATRRMLQGEVTRTYGTTPPVTRESNLRPWWSYWPGALFTACCVILMAVVVMRPAREESFSLAQANNPTPAASTSSEMAATSLQPSADAFGAAPAPGAPPPIESMTERLGQTVVMDKATSIKEHEEMQVNSQPFNKTLPAAEPVAKPATSVLSKDLKASEPFAQSGASAAPSRPAPVLAPIAATPSPTRSQPAPISATTMSAPAVTSRSNLPEDSAKALPEAKMKRMAVTEGALDAPAAAAPTVPPAPGTPPTPASPAKLATASGNYLPMDNRPVAFTATVSDPASNAAGQRFEQTPSRAGMRRNYQSPAVPEVMERFQVQQNGEEVRIIDSDGSVYVGNMNAPEADKNLSLRDAAKKQDAAPAQAVADETRSRGVV
ncbi:MAG: hypothetical protein K0Q55_3766, partial [Verrucomicrobia bacterium]|nr:hypothetical protein [Verrucomicrobiota bacterium]